MLTAIPGVRSFDAGAWKIQYAADPSLCLDAGDPLRNGSQPGALVWVWDCNNLPQQAWGYDSDSGDIYLKDSDPKLCLDVYSDMKLGNQVQVWECNSQPQQLFDINWGTTIRLSQNNTLCLDLIVNPDGTIGDGSLLQFWPCNGYGNQQWIYDSGTGEIRAPRRRCPDPCRLHILTWCRPALPAGTGFNGGDPPLCIDAHDFTAGNRLMIWTCNGMQQQKWGYDAVMNTVYLSLSATSSFHPDATRCMDLSGGAVDPGTAVEIWDCNGCWNQKWLLAGGVEQQAVEYFNSSVRRALDARVLQDPGHCPALPTPPAAECTPGWPIFNKRADLLSDPWGAVRCLRSSKSNPIQYLLTPLRSMHTSSRTSPRISQQTSLHISASPRVRLQYLAAVYGGSIPPALSFPWCAGGLYMLYSDMLIAHKVSHPASVGACPTNAGKTAGQLYTSNNLFQPSNALWIWHPPPYKGLSGWIEVIHMGGLGDEHVGAWFFHAKGSGIWIEVGPRPVWR